MIEDKVKRKRRKNWKDEKIYDDISFDKLLSLILKSDKSFKRVVLVDRTGLTIASGSRFSYFPKDVDGIGAIISAIHQGSEKQGKSLQLGDLTILISEFQDGKVITCDCGKSAILGLVCESECNLGLIRSIFSDVSERFEELLRPLFNE